MELDTERLESMIKLLDGTSIEMLEIEKGKTRVKIVRRFAYQECPVETWPMNAVARQVIGVEPREKEFCIVKSFMDGIFYRSNEEYGEPLVKEGDIVNLNQSLYAIYCMKNLSEVRLGDHKKEFNAEYGKVHKELAENGSLVNVGTPLFSIIPEVIQ